MRSRSCGPTPPPRPLRRDVPVEVDPTDAVLGGWDLEEIRRLFDFLEFRTLWDRFLEATDNGEKGGPAETATGIPLQIALEELTDPTAAIQRLTAWISGGVPLSVAGVWEGREGRSPLRGLALAPLPPGPGPVDVVRFGEAVFDDPGVRTALQDLMGDDGVDISAHDAKALMRGLAQVDLVFSHLQLDTAIAAYLVDPAGDQYVLEELALRYAGLELHGPDGPPPGQLDLGGTGLDTAGEAARRAAAVARLVDPLSAALAARGMSRLYDEVERPLVLVLAKMEELGVRVDVDLLRRLAGELASEARRLEEEIQDLAGTRFVVNSTPQLREILFNKLGLTPQKRTKTGYSTDAQTLEKLRGEHPIVDALLRYREVEKLAVHLRRVAPGRGGSRRADPRHLQPDRRPHRPPELRSTQPAQHPGPQRGGPAVPVLLPAGGRLPIPGGGLQPDRVAGHRPPGRGSWA